MARRIAHRMGAARRRSRPAVEGLESRRLFALLLTGQYSLPSAGTAQISQIVVGPDGNLWFTQNADIKTASLDPYDYYSDASVGSINPTTGVVSNFRLDPSTKIYNGLTVAGITVGPDGNLWFGMNGDPAGGEIGAINPKTDAISEFPVSALVSGVATGADGNIWFFGASGELGRFNPTTHLATEFPLTNADDQPSAIVAGPDGNIWFTEKDSSGVLALGKINPNTLAISEFKTSTTYNFYYSGSITVGPDRKLWFTEGGANQIGVIDPTTGAITELPIPTATLRGPEQITAGPDGDLYFTETLSNSLDTGYDAIGEVNPATDAVFTYPVIPAFPELFLTFTPRAIVTGPDGNLWVGGVDQIDRVLVEPANVSVIRSNVYSDPNEDGTFSGGPLAQRVVYLDLKGDGTLDPGDPSAVTDATGYYTFTGLAPGTYTVRMVTYPGDTATGPGDVSQVIAAGGGQIANPYTFGVASMSAVFPLNWSSAPFGSHNPDVSTAEVNGLYRTILGRAPDPAGGAAAVAALKTGTPLAQVAANLLGSAEYDTDLAASDYQNYLGRSASPAELAYVVAALQGGLRPIDLAADLMASAEFSQEHSRDADFLTAAYGDTLGRAISPPELSAVEGLISGGLSRAAVVVSLLGSTEADLRVVNGFARVFFGQGYNSNLASSVASLQAGTSPTTLATALASGPAFVSRANATVG